MDADLAAIVEAGAPAFALLHRRGRAGPADGRNGAPRPHGARGREVVDVLVGEPAEYGSIADLPLPPIDPAARRPDLVAVLPFRQIAERGLDCIDDSAPLIAVEVRGHATVPLADALAALPADPVAVAGGEFDLTDAEYADIVRRVITANIGSGDGSNFVIRRSFHTVIRGYSHRAGLAVFANLLRRERGAHWTFLVHGAGRTLIGATPECQVRLADGVATMNPISGTYRYPGTGPNRRELRRFLTDRKEADELFMVVDEELKMMARVCDGGGRLHGPWLRPMSRLAHTEYLIDGRSRLDAREILRLTLPAPTVTGSPLATACRIIAQHEGRGRGYYGGVLALIGQRDGRRTLDSALLIRTADISAAGRVEIGVGATLVRHSDPAAEAAETRAKADALLLALGRRVEPDAPAPRAAARFAGFGRLLDGPRTRRELAARNTGLSRFWRGLDGGTAGLAEAALAGRRLLVVDAGDDFTAMLAQLAAALGLSVRIRASAETSLDGDHDVVLLGPGPGDPSDLADARIARLRAHVEHLLVARTPLLAVCLGHQVLASQLGLGLRRLPEPAQGVQRVVWLAGRPERVGFYNTFVAHSDTDSLRCPHTGDPVRVLRDSRTGAVHGLSKPRVRSAQFHMESILTEHGPTIMGRMLISVLGEATGVAFPANDPQTVVSPRTSGRRR